MTEWLDKSSVRILDLNSGPAKSGTVANDSLASCITELPCDLCRDEKLGQGRNQDFAKGGS